MKVALKLELEQEKGGNLNFNTMYKPQSDEMLWWFEGEEENLLLAQTTAQHANSTQAGVLDPEWAKMFNLCATSEEGKILGAFL